MRTRRRRCLSCSPTTKTTGCAPLRQATLTANPATLTALAAGDVPTRSRVTGSLIGNPATPAKILDGLSETLTSKDVGDSYVGWLLLDNESLSAAAMLRVLSVANAITRRSVALQRPHLPESVLRRLGMDRSISVREELAARRDLPDDVFERLSADKDERVVVNVARNAAAPAAVIRRLLADERPRVRDSAERNGALAPDTNAELGKDRALSRSVACNFASPLAMLEQISAHHPDNGWIQPELAGNPPQ